MAEPTARQDHRGIARIGDVDGEASRDQDGLARFQGEGGVDAGAQVQAGAAGRGIGRQQVLHAWIENLDINGVHAGFSLIQVRKARCSRRLPISETSWRARLSLSARGSTVWP